MKHLTIALLLLFVSQSSAQIMVIHRSGLPDVKIQIADIAKITFDSLGGITGSAQPMALKKIKTIMANILPNPFSTKIEYTLEKPGFVSIRVFDMQGKMVRTILNSEIATGHHLATWDFCDNFGHKVGNAPYIINVQIDGNMSSKNLLIVQ